MVGAQNQAAVDGACALNILRDLKNTVNTYVPHAPVNRQRQIFFSVVTEGPIHELWVHYQIDEAYHMTLLRIWRTTIPKEAREFVRSPGKILSWGDLTGIETALRQQRTE
ncbi:hypothetical protein AJ79_08422 [Helicocarpus griseus UAMH5409]|uniref:Uncharacterized protein n=1 Tax=Helicocarpus griseus UAMH5409 TaxID=1447875 RepID=A0A2B7WTJ8_9EURO|nr:hypothetical protein AJ79_08422 [Helicocarpus griseus UAMH5409]